MKGLLLKDLLGLRKYLRTLLLFIAAYALLIFLMDSPYFLGGMIVLMCAMASITSFSFDHVAGWDIYALSLPVSRRDVVRSKYLLSLILTAGGTALSLLVSVLYILFTHSGSFSEALTVGYTLFVVGMVFVAVLLPLIFRFGVEKARLLIVAVFAIPTAIFVALSNFGNLQAPDPQLLVRLLAFSPLILTVLLALSYFLSRAIYLKKEV
jgi:ABC-2 type transport system permease protein